MPPKIPAIPKDLVEYLEAIHPHSEPALTESERAIFYRSGQRSVVAWLRSQLNIQAQNSTAQYVSISTQTRATGRA